MGKFITEVVEREFNAVTDDARVCDSLGQIAEERRHFLPTAQRTGRVRGQQSACAIERGAIADGCEYIQKLTIRFVCVTHPVGGHNWQSARRRKAQQRLVATLFFALLMALKFDVDIGLAVDACQAVEALPCIILAIILQRGSQRSFISASQANET
jgi:hypothetical protein